MVTASEVLIPRKIFFITGLWGTGKSSVVRYFNENPLAGFQFFDFDKGFFLPPKNRQKHLKWRYSQTEYWLQQGMMLSERGTITVVCGMCLYPSQVNSLPTATYFGRDGIEFGCLTAENGIRKDRLVQRGDADMFVEHKEWYTDFYAELRSVDAFMIDTSKLSVQEVAASITASIIGDDQRSLRRGV